MVRQSTISGNTATAGGGGLLNAGVLTLNQSTVRGNRARYGGGLDNSGAFALHMTIILGNTARTTGADCFQNPKYGASKSLSYNLTGAGTGCPDNIYSSPLTVDPAVAFTQVLKPLHHNGGPTMTHALRPRSLAIDAGNPLGCYSTDQRGIPRPQGLLCDIGAFEVETP